MKKNMKNIKNWKNMKKNENMSRRMGKLGKPQLHWLHRLQTPYNTSPWPPSLCYYAEWKTFGLWHFWVCAEAIFCPEAMSNFLG